MNRTHFFIFLFPAAIAAVAVPAAQGAFTFRPLTNLGGTVHATYAYDVSGDGSAVVGIGFDSNNVGVSFLWKTSGELHVFDDADAFAISSDGLAVTGNKHFGFGDTAAFRWTAAGGYQNIETPPFDQAFSRGYALSSDGSVIVGQGGVHPFRWSAATGMTLLGQIPSKESGYALDVSDNGQVIVGHMYHGGTANDEAFRWTSATGMVRLGYLPNRMTQSYGSAVSQDGTVIVGSSSDGGGREAFRWTAGGGMVSLGDLPGGGVDSIASDVSGDGSITVGAGTSAEDLGIAVFWNKQGQIANLRNYLVNRGVPGLDGWRLRLPWAISRDGRTIVGEGFNPQGQQAAWMATIPEPSAGLLAMLSLAGLNAVRRCRRAPGRVVYRRVWHCRQKNVERWAWTIRSTTPRQPRRGHVCPALS
jgi:probable HAF family extracellular repeat protein